MAPSIPDAKDAVRFYYDAGQTVAAAPAAYGHEKFPGRNAPPLQVEGNTVHVFSTGEGVWQFDVRARYQHEQAAGGVYPAAGPMALGALGAEQLAAAVAMTDVWACPSTALPPGMLATVVKKPITPSPAGLEFRTALVEALLQRTAYSTQLRLLETLSLVHNAKGIAHEDGALESEETKAEVDAVEHKEQDSIFSHSQFLPNVLFQVFNETGEVSREPAASWRNPSNTVARIACLRMLPSALEGCSPQEVGEALQQLGLGTSLVGALLVSCCGY